jgi:signal transduction histidine kinase/ActR/RegA family two-component response regulator
MLTKTFYVIIDIIAVIDIIFTIRALFKVKAAYGKRLMLTLMVAIIAIGASIVIALANSAFVAEVAYCVYFSSIDWILYFLAGFCLLYTEHEKTMNKLAVPVALLLAADTGSLFANLFYGHQFSIYEKTLYGTVFYQTSIYPFYYIHLTIAYLVVVLTLFFIIYRIAKSYGLYRMKYVIILSVLLLVILLNLAYMAFSMVLDASVIFYPVAATLIYFCTEVFVPRSLMSTSVGRAVDNMNEGLLLFDIHNNCIFANSFSRYRFGIEPESYDFSCEPIASVIHKLADEGKKYGEVEYVRETPAVTEYYKIRYTSLTDRKARPIGSYFLIQDTTEEVIYRLEIEEAKINADNANRAKSTFLANMSHEIRTPLNSILGMNEMILRSADDTLIREYAENIRDSGDTLLSLINDILDFSKIEAGRMEIIKTEYSTHKLVRDCYHFFEQPAGIKDLYLHVDFDPAVPRKLSGDLLHIKQVLNNIISNAVKYTKEGGVTVTVSSQKLQRDKVELVIEISDTGIGIAKKDVAILFDAFKRINEKENATIQGTGLGLAITRELVKMMEGSIYVDSALGAGSKFRITIPQDVADASPAGPLVLKRSTETNRYKESFRAPLAHILIVDDVPLNLKVAAALLKNTLVQIDTASGGDEAISLCRRRKYDLILLDHRMPNKDGIETFREISENGMNTGTPVVMLTANALRGADQEYKEIGFAGYLSKPIDINALEAMLISLLPGDKVELM